MLEYNIFKHHICKGSIVFVLLAVDSADSIENLNLLHSLYIFILPFAFYIYVFSFFFIVITVLVLMANAAPKMVRNAVVA